MPLPTSGEGAVGRGEGAVVIGMEEGGGPPRRPNMLCINVG